MTTHKKTLIGRVQEQVEKSATAAEEIHKAIADLPLKMLEGSRMLRKPAKRMRRAQDRAIGALYEMIRKVTHTVGEFASERLAATRRAAAHAERVVKSDHAHAA
ncbi:MAG: hypothetical protein IT293_19265 [Deltaproteobacteria bacterium]|nr:hypothetical protein [Deltaproteobacteria bacterium]